MEHVNTTNRQQLYNTNSSVPPSFKPVHKRHVCCNSSKQIVINNFVLISHLQLLQTVLMLLVNITANSTCSSSWRNGYFWETSDTTPGPLKLLPISSTRDVNENSWSSFIVSWFTDCFGSPYISCLLCFLNSFGEGANSAGGFPFWNLVFLLHLQCLFSSCLHAFFLIFKEQSPAVKTFLFSDS